MSQQYLCPKHDVHFRGDDPEDCPRCQQEVKEAVSGKAPAATAAPAAVTAPAPAKPTHAEVNQALEILKRARGAE